MKKAYIFAGVGSGPGFTCTDNRFRFFRPTGGLQSAHELSGFCFVDGVSTLAQSNLEAHTRGRNTGAKPSQWKEGRCYGGRNSTTTFQTHQRGVSWGLSTDGTHPVKQLVGKSVGTTMPFPNPNKNLNQ